MPIVLDPVTVPDAITRSATLPPMVARYGSENVCVAMLVPGMDPSASALTSVAVKARSEIRASSMDPLKKSAPALVAFLTAWSVFAAHRIFVYELPLLGAAWLRLRLAAVVVLPFIAGSAALFIVRSNIWRIHFP